MAAADEGRVRAPAEGAVRQPGVLGSPRIRDFAAATVLALSAALAVSVAREVEALGLLVGRATLELTELPVGETKADQIDEMTAAADRADVSVSLMVPDRDGRPGVWTAYSFRGAAEQPGVGATVRTRPIRDGGTLDLLGPMAVDGDRRSVRRFTDELRRAGYTTVDTTPAPVAALVVVLTRPTVALATRVGVSSLRLPPRSLKPKGK